MNQSLPSEPRRTQDVYEQLAAITREDFGPHPFSAPIARPALDHILPDYLAMSQAFPYLQAAAQKDVIFDAIHDNKDVPAAMELTHAVGSFLTWDESGGNYVIMTQGKAALPRILETSRWFHSNVLRDDIRKILGRPVEANYGPATRDYLFALYRGLASLDIVERCAHMVAFELHAEAMINALWATLTRVTGLPREDLAYFYLHTGGDDPAEKYHVELTQDLIERVVPEGRYDDFMGAFRRAYALNIAWCRAVVEGQSPAANEEIWHRGACHCGGVRFEVRAPAVLDVVRCNCSICAMSGFLHVLLPADRFRLLGGEELLTTYQFNRKIAKHTFCRVCGTKAFYRPRSNPEGFSVNARCLDQSTVAGLNVTEFDGQHWEESIGGLSLPA